MRGEGGRRATLEGWKTVRKGKRTKGVGGSDSFMVLRVIRVILFSGER